jgi:anaerobic C4-dicarboxylate transporter
MMMSHQQWACSEYDNNNRQENGKKSRIPTTTRESVVLFLFAILLKIMESVKSTSVNEFIQKKMIKSYGF